MTSIKDLKGNDVFEMSLMYQKMYENSLDDYVEVVPTTISLSASKIEENNSSFREFLVIWNKIVAYSDMFNYRYEAAGDPKVKPVEDLADLNGVLTTAIARLKLHFRVWNDLVITNDIRYNYQEMNSEMGLILTNINSHKHASRVYTEVVKKSKILESYISKFGTNNSPDANHPASGEIIHDSSRGEGISYPTSSYDAGNDENNYKAIEEGGDDDRIFNFSDYFDEEENAGDAGVGENAGDAGVEETKSDVLDEKQVSSVEKVIQELEEVQNEGTQVRDEISSLLNDIVAQVEQIDEDKKKKKPSKEEKEQAKEIKAKEKAENEVAKKAADQAAKQAKQTAEQAAKKK